MLKIVSLYFFVICGIIAAQKNAISNNILLREENMKQIGDILIDQGLITEGQLEKGLKISKEQNTRLGKALIDLGYITEPELLSTLSDQFGIPMMPAEELVVDPTLLHLISPQIAKQYNIIPISQKGDAILLATSDPMNTAVVGNIENHIKTTKHFLNLLSLIIISISFR